MTRHERILRLARRRGDRAAIAILEGRLCAASPCRRRARPDYAWCDAHAHSLMTRVLTPRFHGHAA